jgi:hypothetical protein
VVGSFFFVERTITGDIYLDLLEQFVFPQVDDIERENATGVVFQLFPGVGYICCSRTLVAIYYRQLVGCHLVSFLRSLSLSPAYKKVDIRLGASGITAK